MTQEKLLRSHVVAALKPLDARPVENPVDPGFPDVEFVGGTIELKKLEHWPVRAETPVKLDHYTQQQRVWHTRRWTKGGNVTLLLQVESEYLLFTGIVAATILGHVPQAELRREARVIFPTLAAMREGLLKAVQEAR